ncbi:unnamed protein product, partial [Adineta ricciae]
MLQIFLLICTTLLYDKCNTNPNPSSSNDHVSCELFASNFAIKLVPNVSKLLVWISTLYQILYLILQSSSPTSIPTFFPQMSELTDPLPLTLVSMLGYMLMIIGGLGRVWCFKTLGRFFTFEVTIRDSHKLIKTGPYAYVRHLSYTFAIILITGMCLIHQQLGDLFPETYWTNIIFAPLSFFPRL